MIIFNTTYHIDDDIHDECLKYITHSYIPKAIASGFLLKPLLAKIYAQHENNGTSYSLQFKVKNTDTLDYWMQKEGDILQKELTRLYGNKALGFITLLEEIDL